jgi:hypothetical protein
LNGKSVRKNKSIAIAKIVAAPCRESFRLFALSTAVRQFVAPGSIAKLQEIAPGSF